MNFVQAIYDFNQQAGLLEKRYKEILDKLYVS